MFDRLVALLMEFLSFFQFCTVMRAYSKGVVLRFGKFHREIGPGFHWLWPFYIEEVASTNYVPETMNVGPQSLTTKDGKPVVISTVVTFFIEDVRKFLLDVEGGNQVIEDSTYGSVATHVHEFTWEELLRQDLANELTKVVRRKAKRYGVGIDNVQLSDFTQSRSYRLMTPQH